MPSQNNEKSLIKRAKQGDSAALGALYELYAAAIYRFMFYRTGDAMVAEDLAAEVFAHMITAIGRYRDIGVPFQAWLFRIARARLADYWRQIKRRERHQDAIAAQDKSFSVYLLPETLENHFEYEQLRKAFHYLTPGEREVILLRFVGCLSNKEIAAVIHSNANAVKSKMRRALRKLRGIVERQLTFDEGGKDI